MGTKGRKQRLVERRQQLGFQRSGRLVLQRVSHPRASAFPVPHTDSLSILQAQRDLAIQHLTRRRGSHLEGIHVSFEGKGLQARYGRAYQRSQRSRMGQGMSVR